jgi:hypothetical protein
MQPPPGVSWKKSKGRKKQVRWLGCSSLATVAAHMAAGCVKACCSMNSIVTDATV